MTSDHVERALAVRSFGPQLLLELQRRVAQYALKITTAGNSNYGITFWMEGGIPASHT
jgi:hypothetical protein